MYHTIHGSYGLELETANPFLVSRTQYLFSVSHLGLGSTVSAPYWQGRPSQTSPEVKGFFRGLKTAPYLEDLEGFGKSRDKQFQSLSNIYNTYQVIQSDLLIPQLKVTWPVKGSLKHSKQGHQQNCQVYSHLYSCSFLMSVNPIPIDILNIFF